MKTENRVKNIAILSYSLTGGGAERIAGLLSKWLSERYKVYLFLCDTSTITYDYSGTIVDLFVDGEVNAEKILKECKRRYQIDCAVSFLVTMNCLNLRTRTGESVIISNRASFGEMVPQHCSTSNKIRKWYRDADKIVSCSYGAKYDLMHYYGIDGSLITPIYNFIDKDRIRQNAQLQLPWDVKTFIGNSMLILNVGRLDKQKNQEKLLVQFSKLLEEGYDAKLIILGSGSLEGVLKELAEKLAIADKVLFEIYCKNPFPYYKAADVMACSTDWEGLPNVVLEAMTLGLPVVSVDCLSGPRELLKGDCDYSVRTKGVEVCERGILVEQADTDSTGETAYFAAGLKQLLDDAGLREKMSMNEKKYMDQYDNEKIFQAWTDVIEEARPRMEASRRAFEILDEEKKIIVYGAGIWGEEIMKHLLQKGKEHDLLCFAVTNKADNPKSVCGIPVYQISELLEHREDAVVVIGVSKKFENSIKEILDQYGFRYVFSDI